VKNWICPKEYTFLKADNKLFHKQLEVVDVSIPEVNNIHFLARREFVLDSVGKTMLYLTADDYYMLYINGDFVTQGPAPSYPSHQSINEIDITSYLRDGKNVIAVHCFYCGFINRVYTSADGRIGLWARLLADGSEILVTDESWKITIDKSFMITEMTGYNTQAVENRDMNLYHHGWNEVGFDDGCWENAVVLSDDDHVAEIQRTPNVASKIVSAEKITYFGEEHFLIDFGAELVGCVLIDVCGKKDAKVRVMCGEELLDDGHVRSKMRCNCTYDETVILSGKHDKVLNFEYKGFRYVEVISGDSGVTPENIFVLKRNYPVENPVEFRSSDKDLEDIWNICRNAVIIGSQEGFLDCPTREKGQYLGDLVITALSHIYVTGDARLYRKALYDFAYSAFICKGLMAVSPGSYMQEIADYSLLYPLLLKKYYDLTGDKEIVLELLPISEGCVDHFGKFKNANGLLECVNDKWNLVDWPKNLRDGYDFVLSNPIGPGCHNAINAYYYGAMDTVNELRGIAGLDKKYDTESFRNKYNEAFLRTDRNLYADSITSEHCNFHSNVLPMCFGIVDDSLVDHITEFVMERGLCCGVYFSHFVFRGLARYGKYDEIYTLMMNDSIHSWKNMLREGATSAFEAWGKDQKWNTSLCHPWASTPISAIIEYILGYRFEAGVMHRGETHLPNGVAAELIGGFTKTNRFIN